MDETTGRIKRPELLKIICILTFVGSGFSLFSYALLAFYSEVFVEIASGDQFSFFRSDEERQMIIEIFSLPKVYFLLQVLFYALSLLGAYKMWTLKKIGFHFYAVSQISLLIVYKAFIPAAPFPLFALAVTVIFILLYFRNLQYMS